MAAWAVKWKMEFNIKKCKVMPFGAANRRQQYMMDGHVLEETREERDIGVIVSERSETSSTVCKGGQNGNDSAGADHEVVPV
jgi:hypothetical protein